MAATTDNEKEYNTEVLVLTPDNTSQGDDSFIDLSQSCINAPPDPMSADDDEGVKLSSEDAQSAIAEHLAALYNGNHNAQTQFERDFMLIAEAMLSLKQPEGRSQAQFLIAVYALLLSGDVYYCSKADSIFDPKENDCANFEKAAYRRLSDQPDTSEKLPIVSLLCHVSRLLAEAPVDLRTRVLTWILNKENEEVKGCYVRYAATHGIGQRKTSIQLGSEKAHLEELKLNGFGAVIGFFSRQTSFSDDQLYGIDLALGGIGKHNPISNNLITNDGAHGHAFICTNSVNVAGAEDSTLRGGMLLGIEPSASGCHDQYGGTHSLGAPQSFSATGGDPFYKLVSEKLYAVNEVYDGLNKVDLAGYYGNLRVLVNEERFARAQLLAQHLEYIICSEAPRGDEDKILKAKQSFLKSLLMSVGFINEQKIEGQPPSIFQSLKTLGESFCFKAREEGESLEIWIPKLDEISKVDITSLKKEYHCFLNNCLQVLEDNNPCQSNVFVSTLAAEQEASSRQVQYGCARLPQMKTSAILRQYLTLEGESVGFKRLQGYENDVLNYFNVEQDNNTAIAHVWNLCGHLTVIFSMIVQIQKLQKSGATSDEMVVPVLNLRTEYEAAQVCYQQLKRQTPTWELSEHADHLPSSSFYHFTDAELEALSSDELTAVCLEEADTLGYDSPLLERIVKNANCSTHLLKCNLDLFEGRANAYKHIAFLRGKVAHRILEKKNELLEKELDSLKGEVGTPKSESPSMSPRIFTPFLAFHPTQPLDIAAVNKRLLANNVTRPATLQRLGSLTLQEAYQANQVLNTKLLAKEAKVLELQTQLETIFSEKHTLEIALDAEQKRVTRLDRDLRTIEAQLNQLEEQEKRPSFIAALPNLVYSKAASEASTDDSDFEEDIDSTPGEYKEDAEEISGYNSSDETCVCEKAMYRAEQQNTIIRLEAQLNTTQEEIDDLQKQLESAQAGISKAELEMTLKLHELLFTIDKIKPLEDKKNNAFESIAFLSVVMAQACIISAVCSVGVLTLTVPILLALGIGLIRNISAWVTARQLLKELNADDPEKQLKTLEEANPKLSSLLLGAGFYKNKKPGSTEEVVSDTPALAS